MKIIGITGTNGKTTVTYLLTHILTSLGYKTSLIGTINARLTTPSPWELAEYLEKFTKEKKDFVIMEVSSHGIKQDRVRGIDFTVKALTNITRDHLDFHKTFRDYKYTKMSWLKQGVNIKIYPHIYKKYKVDFEHQLLGAFNEDNIRITLAITDALNLDQAKVKQTFKTMPAVPGRFELVCNKSEFKVVVDYAHTPDGLLNAVKSAREILKKENHQGKLITLFGCGGDRDRGKRPKMGKIACKYSDQIIITSDNPRTENKQAIIKEILTGISRTCHLKTIIESDRKKALKKAIKIAHKHDLVLVAGKGHEDYQVIGKKKYPFDDRKLCKQYLDERELLK